MAALRGRRWLWAPPLISAVLAVWLHVGTIDYPFVWDDRAAVMLNKDVTGDRQLSRLWRNDFWGQAMNLVDSHKSYRPISVLSLRLNHFFGGLNPRGYHVVNLILHGGTSALVSLVAWVVSSDGNEEKLTQRFTAAIVTGALFACHPVHVEPVVSIVGRADILSGALSLAALLCYFCASPELGTETLSPGVRAADFGEKKRSWNVGWLTMAFACAAVASFSKELGVTTFGLFVVHEIIEAVVLNGKSSREDHRSWWFEPIRNGVACFGRRLSPGTGDFGCALRCAASCGGVAMVVGLHFSLHGDAGLYRWSVLENHVALLGDPLARVLSYAYLHSAYAAKLLWPVDWLCYDHGYDCLHVVTSARDPYNAAAFALYATLFACGLHALSSCDRTALWALALLAVPFVPASQAFFPVGTVLGERLLYLPSVGYALGLAHVLTPLLLQGSADLLRAVGVSASAKGGKGDTKGVPPSPPRAAGRALVAWAGLAVYTGVLGWHTVTRSQDWRSELVLFESAMAVCPRSLKVLNNLALRIMDDIPEGTRRAGELLDTCLSINGNFTQALFNRGLAHHFLGEHLESIPYFERALATNVGDAKTTACLARAHLRTGIELRDAVDSGLVPQRDAQAAKAEAAALSQRARVLLEPNLEVGIRRGEYGIPLAHYVLGLAAMELGDGVTAAAHLEHSLGSDEATALARGSGAPELLGPQGRAAALNSLGVVLRDLGRIDEALRAWERGGAIEDAVCFECFGNAAGALGDRGDLAGAAELYGRARNLAPESAEIANNLGFLYERAGDFLAAADLYREALRLGGRHVQIETNLKNAEARLLAGASP